MIESLPPAERSSEIRRMFGAIAPSYDRTNTVLSMGLHHVWRSRAVKELAAEPQARLLDLCCGTGDLAFALAASLGPEGAVTGVDFCPEMVAIATDRASDRPSGPGSVEFAVGDATSLPFEANHFDGATVSFGIRNVVPPEAGLAELARVVRPGGQVLVLEFGQPEGLIFGPVFRWYSRVAMPWIGGLMSGSRAAYEYLPRTSQAFPAGANFVQQLLLPSGLVPLKSCPLAGGVAWLYLAEVPTR